MINLNDTGFVIVSSDCNYGKIKSTFIAIKSINPTLSIKCVLPSFADDKDRAEVTNLCPFVQCGTNSIVGLINEGLISCSPTWNLILFAGTRLSLGCLRKYSLFKRSENDVLSPVIFAQDRLGRIAYESPYSLNGTLIHLNTFKKIGYLEDMDILNSYQNWVLKGIAKGCNFKGIVGTRAF